MGRPAKPRKIRALTGWFVLCNNLINLNNGAKTARESEHTMTTITAPTHKQLIDAAKPAVELYLVAKANAELTRERIDAIAAEVFADYFGEQLPVDEYTGEPVTNEGDLYQADGHFDGYYERRHAAIVAAGFDVTPRVCPALEAEGLVRNAERNIVKQLERLTGVTVDLLLANGLKKYRSYIDLAVRAVVAAG